MVPRLHAPVAILSQADVGRSAFFALRTMSQSSISWSHGGESWHGQGWQAQGFERSSPYKKIRGAETLYAFCTFQAVGFPWSESDPGISFVKWAKRSFPTGYKKLDVTRKFHLLSVSESGDQFQEFSTAAPTRAAYNELLKPPQAVVKSKYPEDCKVSSGGVKLSLRTIRTSDVSFDDVVYDKDPSSFQKLWLAVRINTPLNIRDVSQEDFKRSHPEMIPSVFTDERDRKCVKKTIGRMVDSFLKRAQENKQRDDIVKLKCMKRLVEWFDRPQEGAPRPDQKSTQWLPGRYNEFVVEPGDITKRGCICCKGEKFPRWISIGCGGVGVFRVAPRTLFGDEGEILSAIMHDFKFQLLSKLRTCAINENDIIRCGIFEDNPTKVRIAARMGSMTQKDEKQSAHWYSSDKHRIIFLLPQKKFMNALRGGMTIGDDTLVRLWKMGSLHVLDSAPRYVFAKRITINPPSETFGDHIGIMLEWYGNHLFYHDAIVKNMHERNPRLQLGIMRSLFKVHPEGPICDEPLHEKDHSNIFHGRCGANVIEEFERSQGLKMARDQLDCLKRINASEFSMFHITALAGTGKTAIMCVLLRCLIPILVGTEQVAVVLVPGKNLRDEVLTNLDMLGPEYKNHPATKVLWLGQQAENSEQVTYEAKIEDEVKKKLAPQRGHLADLENKLIQSCNNLKKRFETQKWKDSWKKLVEGFMAFERGKITPGSGQSPLRASQNLRGSSAAED